jgi:hypothetical protein
VDSRRRGRKTSGRGNNRRIQSAVSACITLLANFFRSNLPSSNFLRSNLVATNLVTSNLLTSDLGNEGIASSGEGGDVVGLARIIVEHLAENSDGLIQVVLADRCSGPDPGNQFSAGKTLALMFDQHEQRVKDLGREDNDCAEAQKAASGGIEAKGAKLV